MSDNEIEEKRVYDVGSQALADPAYSGDEKGSFKKDSGSEDQEDYEVVNTREVLDTDGIIRNAIDTTDNIHENAWTFRSVFLGIGLAIFGSVLGEIYYFKPQTIVVNGIFLVMIAYVIAEAMDKAIPRHTDKPGLKWLNPILWFLNPHPFNIKEHTLIAIIATTASTAALGTEVLAVQKLWYTSSVSQGVGIFVIFSSQILGYGIVGLVRKVLVYPTKMFYPNILPQVVTLQTLHKDKSQNHKRLKIFYISFGCLFLWEIVPEYMFQLLIGFSIPCLAAPNSEVVSYLFGGTNGNEGLGLLSFCFDWQYIASTSNPMAIPIQATMNNLFGYFLCIACFMGMYYTNVWDGQKFPFLSQELYTGSGSNGTVFEIFNQSFILSSDNNLNVTALEEIGVPFLTPTYTLYLIATNLSIAATFTYMALWHWDVVEIVFYWLKPSEMDRPSWLGLSLLGSGC
jgi:OPT family oligopeptide transporter